MNGCTSPPTYTIYGVKLSDKKLHMLYTMYTAPMYIIYSEAGERKHPMLYDMYCTHVHYLICSWVTETSCYVPYAVPMYII